MVHQEGKLTSFSTSSAYPFGVEIFHCKANIDLCVIRKK